MSNVSLTLKGGGFYDEDQWNQHFIEAGLATDWWVPIKDWQLAKDAIAGIQTDVVASRRSIAEIITGLKKDAPVDIDRRFAGSVGVLGAANYRAAPLFIRFDKSAQATLYRMARLGDQPVGSRDQELDRNNKTPMPSTSSGSSISSKRDLQPLRDGALHLTCDLAGITQVDFPIYNRAKFESDFNLTWIPRAQNTIFLGGRAGDGA